MEPGSLATRQSWPEPVNDRARSSAPSFFAESSAIPYFQSNLVAIRVDLGHVHGVRERRERVETSGRLGAELVAELPQTLRQLLEEEGHLAIAQLLVRGARAPGVARADLGLDLDVAARAAAALVLEGGVLGLAEARLALALLQLLGRDRLAAPDLHGLEPGRLQVLEHHVLELVLGLEGEHDLDAVAARQALAILERRALIDGAGEQGLARGQAVAVAAHEDLVPARRDRFLEREEARPRREVERPRAGLLADADRVRAVAQERGVDLEGARRREELLLLDALRRHALAVDRQLVLDGRAELAARAQVVVQRQHADRRVAR